MLLLRDAQPTDLPRLTELAAELNTINLPNNQDMLEELLETSGRSFSGEIADPFKREYLFVLEDTSENRIWGTSMMIAQHGTYQAPHVYYDVSVREHYSATLGKLFRHRVLSIAYNYEGPTEIGGLVVDPSKRASGQKPGKQLSYGRFLYLAMHRANFRENVLAELLPPLLPDGRSLLWEACGTKFTGLTYQEADRLSRSGKEFIKELFPPSDIYVSLFPEEAQKVVGEVGAQTRGVQRMLERIGFKYSERVDPFDGGPHFEAKVSEVSLIQAYRVAVLDSQPPHSEGGQDVLLASARPTTAASRFRAMRALVSIHEDTLRAPAEVTTALGLRPGDSVAVIPFP